MAGRSIKIGTGIVVALIAGTFLMPSTAFADYAPSSGDVVGVGSDTVQAAGDFLADGSYASDPGYNSSGNKNKFISIDATADANTRLAYGPQGTGPACAPGTGGGIGTGNSGVQDSAHTPCVLNPTVTLRAGLSPEQRPNGSGAGYNVLAADTTSAGAAIGNGGTGLVNFSRASAAKNGGNVNFDAITVGSDTLAMLSSSASTTHAVALTKAQLAAIYQCTTTTWNQVGGSSSDTIVPLIPQVGSGTRSTFLSDIGIANPNTACVQTVEENDPYAIADSATTANPNGIDAIEPMSGSRLNLFLGLDGTGSPTGVAGYFKDPSCPFNPATSTSVGTTSNSPTQCHGTTATLTPPVKAWTTGSPSGGGTIYTDQRNLFIYFRHSDINSPKAFQPGSSLNWVRTMLYNPCPVAVGNPAFASDGCSIDASNNPVGPGGDPYLDTAAGQQDISDAGVTANWAYTPAAP